jgi:hypothetical protein
VPALASTWRLTATVVVSTSIAENAWRARRP